MYYQNLYSVNVHTIAYIVKDLTIRSSYWIHCYNRQNDNYLYMFRYLGQILNIFNSLDHEQKFK